MNLTDLSHKKVLISIEGNIGSGKSTLYEMLKEKYKDKILFIDEPVNEWNNITMDGKNLLEYYYENNKKWGYLFQSVAFITRLNKLKEAINNPKYSIIISERTLESDKKLFAQLLYENGNMNELEWKSYNLWFDYFNIKMTHYIYLKADVNECIKRIKRRNRKGEDEIPYDYLKKLSDNHDKWLIDNPRCIIIDSNLNIFNDNVKKNHCDIINKLLINYIK